MFISIFCPFVFHLRDRQMFIQGSQISVQHLFFGPLFVYPVLDASKYIHFVSRLSANYLKMYSTNLYFFYFYLIFCVLGILLCYSYVGKKGPLPLLCNDERTKHHWNPNNPINS